MRRAGTLAAVVAAVAAMLLTAALGQWQLRRAQQKLELQSQWDEAMRAAPLVLDQRSAADIARRLPARVRVRGEFIHEATAWLDNRPLGGRAGFWVATPLRIERDAVVLVLRGWAPRDVADRTRLPAVGRPPGTVDLQGLAIAQVPRLLELGRAGPTRLPGIVQNLDFDAIEKATGMSVLPLVVQQDSELEDGLTRRWARPDLGVDKHRGYALQWFSLCGLIFALTVFFALRAMRRHPGRPR
jgi:surfeit locus 1 family protein